MSNETNTLDKDGTSHHDRTEAQLVLDQIEKTYKQIDEPDVVAVEDLSIEIEKGEFLVLVGPSGCGKSTTLHCIAGLEEITDGELRIDGKVVNDQKPEQRNIAMVFQNYALYPHMTARQNMGFGLKMVSDLSSEEINERVQDVAEMLGISELLDKKPKELSGGQQQRVALGRAIVRKPSVFLMDEPLSNLDAKLRTEMRTEIQELQSNLNVTTVYVTHDQTEAMTMGDRIAVLNNGELQQCGTPLECYHQPVNKFVASFIGEPSMNFFEVERHDDQLVSDSFEYNLSADTVSELGTATDLVLGIRPDAIEIVDDDGETTVTATVSVVEPMGDRQYLHLDVNGHDVTATTNEEILVDEGEKIRLLFPEKSIHLFDNETGDALVNPRSSSTAPAEAINTEVDQK